MSWRATVSLSNAEKVPVRSISFNICLYKRGRKTRENSKFSLYDQMSNHWIWMKCCTRNMEMRIIHKPECQETVHSQLNGTSHMIQANSYNKIKKMTQNLKMLKIRSGFDLTLGTGWRFVFFNIFVKYYCNFSLNYRAWNSEN